jgi:murein DD-endopeptidase MepM/ murein hydrolase activator NlpD
MDFIKILGGIISEQQRPTTAIDARDQGWKRTKDAAKANGGCGDSDLDQVVINGKSYFKCKLNTVSQSNSSSSGGSSHSWKSGDKISSPLKNPGKCNYYHQWRQYYNKGKGGYHDACDIAVNVGTALFAPYDGTFTEVDNDSCGNGIDLTGEVDGKTLYSRFCHLRSRQVPYDGKVKKGDLIGFTGGGKKYGSNTEYEPGAGNTTGPHLHWTFKVNGKKTNPYTYN